MKIKQADYIIMIVFAFVVGLIAFTFFDSAEAQDSLIEGTLTDDAGSVAVVSASIAPSGFSPVMTGTTGSGDVAIELRPHSVSDGLLSVDISVNTHSVSLENFDLKQITDLTFAGKTLKPIDTPILQGHHNNGVLVFDVGEEIFKFTITIRGIPKMQERVFKWG